MQQRFTSMEGTFGLFGLGLLIGLVWLVAFLSRLRAQGGAQTDSEELAVLLSGFVLGGATCWIAWLVVQLLQQSDGWLRFFAILLLPLIPGGAFLTMFAFSCSRNPAISGLARGLLWVMTAAVVLGAVALGVADRTR